MQLSSILYRKRTWDIPRLFVHSSISHASVWKNKLLWNELDLNLRVESLRITNFKEYQTWSGGWRKFQVGIFFRNTSLMAKIFLKLSILIQRKNIREQIISLVKIKCWKFLRDFLSEQRDEKLLKNQVFINTINYQSSRAFSSLFSCTSFSVKISMLKQHVIIFAVISFWPERKYHFFSFILSVPLQQGEKKIRIFEVTFSRSSECKFERGNEPYNELSGKENTYNELVSNATFFLLTQIYSAFIHLKFNRFSFSRSTVFF